MRFLYFDAFNGVSGDMILGALVHLGVPLPLLREELSKLDLQGYQLEAEEIVRQGLTAMNLQVHTQDQEIVSGHHHHHSHSGGSAPHRGYGEIKSLIEESSLSQGVKSAALRIFLRLAEAEAKVHGTSLEEVHFHEVGAVDSIVDIVGAAIGFHHLEIDRFYCSPLALGGGQVSFSHGTWPVPTPATVELTKGFPVCMGPVQAELTTPTGAAIVTTLARPAGHVPLFLERSGLGAGDRRFEEIPNFLRLFTGRVEPELTETKDPTLEEIVLLEAAVDNMDGEMVGYFLEQALSRGALDVYHSSLHMKKNRPGVLLSVLCRAQDRKRLAELIFRQTTTLGVRWSTWQRWVLERRTEQVETEWGRVRIKVAHRNGQVFNMWPEYEDLKRIAQEHDLPLKWLRQKVMEQLGSWQYG